MFKTSLLRFHFLLLSLLLCQGAYSQDLKIGIRAGILLANMDISPLPEGSADFKNQVGLQVAVPLEIGLGNIFAIQPELMYGLHGTRTDETINEVDLPSGITTTGYSKVSIKVQSLEIPLLAKVKFGPEAFKIHVLAGPSIGFGLSGKFKNDYSLKQTDEDGNVIFNVTEVTTGKAVFLKDGYNSDKLGDNDLPVNRTNFNLHLGAGFSVNVGTMSVFLDGRYIIGLNDHFPDEEGTEDDEKLSGKSQRIGISVGLLFPL